MNGLKKAAMMVALGTGIAAAASATLIVDRGLPTTNLNDGAGVNRSNSAWAGRQAGFIGDDFTLGTAGTEYQVKTIRTWITGGINEEGSSAGLDEIYSSLTLWLGNATSTMAATTYSFTATKVSYTSGAIFEDFGVFRDIWQLDWDVSGLTMAGGSTKLFGVSGLTTPDGGDIVGGRNAVYLHASNAGLGGSRADGANQIMNRFDVDGAFVENDPSDWRFLGGETMLPNDINVQVEAVSAEAVPEPFTLALGAAGLLSAIRRRRQR